jgi:hypothetical protein
VVQSFMLPCPEVRPTVPREAGSGESGSNLITESTGDLSATWKVILYVVDALGLVHAMILRLQALVLPFKTLVFSGH